MIIPALMLFVTSCYKDEGNYDYKDINEITISDLGGPYQVLFRVDTLRIEPELEFTMDTNDPDRYVYEWRAGTLLDNNKRPLIGSEKNLEYPITLLPGSYTLYYNVRDKVTGVTWTRSTSVQVTTAVATGFYLAGEDEEGYSEVDMVAVLPADTVIVKGLLTDNGMPRYRQPIRTFHTGTSSSASYVKLWVMSGEGSYFVNTTTFETSPLNVFNRLVFSTFDLPEDIYPVEVAPRVFSSSGSQMTSAFSRIVLTNTGDLFAASLFQGDIYGNPVNRIASRPLETIRLAPFLMYTTTRWNKFLVFDEDNGRFLWGTGGSVPGAMLTVLNDSGGPFPWNQGETNRKLIYAENTKNFDDGSSFGNSFALMKDDQNQFHIYKFYAEGISAPAKRGYYPIKPVAESFEQASDYSFASTRTVLFYSVGSKLYAYDYNPGFEKNYLVHDFGEEITMVHVDAQVGIGNELYVATYNPVDGGTIRKFTMGNDLNNLEVTMANDVHWTGLLKVKNMDWRRSTQ